DVSTAEPKVVATETVRQSWFGLAVDRAEAKIWWAGGGFGRLHTFDLADGKFVRTSKPEPEPKKEAPARKKDEPTAPVAFKSGVCLDESNGLLYSLDINFGTIAAINIKDQAVWTSTIGGRPYDAVLGPGGHQLFVSDWAGSQVLVIDPAEMRVVRKIPVGEHPNQ